MTKNYTQLSLVQRYQIQSLWIAGMTQKFISNQIAVHPSTICRELDRNTAKRGRTSGHYVATNAQRKTNQRHQDKPKQVLFSLAMKQLIVKQLTVDKWSPEFISAKGNQTGKCPLSHEWIYQWIWACKHGNKKEDAEYKQLYKHLRHGKRRRKRGNRKDNRGIIQHRISIEHRPVIVNKRERLGDIEVDLMMGKNHKGALLVMTDRACLHTRLVKLQGKTSLEVKRAMIQVLTKTKYPLHTLTFDNDKAFSEHQSIGIKVAADTYFTRPYTSQDKGTVENRIGVIRRFFPKKTDLLLITKNDVKLVERKLNNRPVRKFNYLTPNEVLQQKSALIT